MFSRPLLAPHFLSSERAANRPLTIAETCVTQDPLALGCCGSIFFCGWHSSYRSRRHAVRAPARIASWVHAAEGMGQAALNHACSICLILLLTPRAPHEGLQNCTLAHFSTSYTAHIENGCTFAVLWRIKEEFATYYFPHFDRLADSLTLLCLLSLQPSLPPALQGRGGVPGCEGLVRAFGALP